MKKINIFLLFVISNLFLSCAKISDGEENSIQQINIFSDHKFISDQNIISSNLSRLLNSNVTDIESHIIFFQDTWVYSIQSKKKWPNSFDIKVQEHQPLARLRGKSFLTHSGHIIFPDDSNTKLDVIYLEAPDDELLNIFYASREIQSQLNRVNSKIISFELRNKDLLRAVMSTGGVLTFSKKDFRVQLKRLEDFISFELGSGKLEKIRNIDFRYNNAIAVEFS
jgi:cell division septal protein FtsQ